MDFFIITKEGFHSLVFHVIHVLLASFHSRLCQVKLSARKKCRLVSFGLGWQKLNEETDSFDTMECVYNRMHKCMYVPWENHILYEKRIVDAKPQMYGMLSLRDNEWHNLRYIDFPYYCFCGLHESLWLKGFIVCGLRTQWTHKHTQSLHACRAQYIWLCFQPKNYFYLCWDGAKEGCELWTIPHSSKFIAIFSDSVLIEIQ